MSQQFKAKVNSSFNFDINSEDISKLDTVKVSGTNYHLLHKNQSFSAEVITSNFNKKQYHISINNNLYKVDISDELDMLIDAMGFSISSKKAITSIIAPMPGLILEIGVKVGQHIKENDSLLILEAMKMENNITSPIDGIIKAIHAKQGDAVEKNQLIIEFEN